MIYLTFFLQLGAVEFLLKPLSDDKLKNIWQHVVHKVCLNFGWLMLGFPIKEQYSNAVRRNSDL